METTIVALGDIAIDPKVPARTVPATPAEDAELRASVAQWGVLAPLLLRQRGNRLVLVKGARRLAAAREAGLAQLPVRVFAEDDAISDAAIRATAGVRAALHPVEKWRAMEAMLREGMDVETAGRTIGVTPRSARQLSQLGRMIPELLDAMAQRLDGLHDHWLHTIAQAPHETQQAAWKSYGKKFLANQVGWHEIFSACVVSKMPRSRARFDDAAAARHGITWQEDLFAEAGQDTRHTTEVLAFRAAQVEWMEAQVEGLIGLGYQAQILDAEKTGVPVLGKDFEQVAGKEDKAPKSVVRGYYIDTQMAVHCMLYRRKKAEPAKPGATKGAKGKAEAPEPQPESAKPEPRGFTKKGLALIAEAKERALEEALERPLDGSAFDEEERAVQLLHALLIALTGENVKVYVGKYQVADMRELLAGLVQPSGQPEDPTLDTLIAQAGAALRLLLHAPRPEERRSGAAFDRAALVVGAEAPRVDSEEVLAELPKAVLGATLAVMHGQPAKGGQKELARNLAGKLEGWHPPEAEFRPAPLAAGDDDDDAAMEEAA